MLRRARLHQFSAPQLAVIGALLLFCSVLSSICTVLYVSLPSHESGLPSSSYLAPICVHPADELRYPADDEPAVDAARVYAPLQLSNCTVYSQRADECQLPPVSLSAVTSMDVAITACGLAYRQDAIVNIKSWLLQRRETVALHFHLVLDDGEPPLTFVEQIKSFRSVFRSWPQAYTDPAHFLVSYYNIASLPAQLSAHLDAFRRCATARLFVAHLLPESLSAVVYVDVDTVAVADTRRLWAEFQLHSPTQFFGIAWAADDSASFKWYQEKVARAFPWPRPWGLNSGVLLLNLTKLRRFRRRVDASVPGNWAVVDGRLVSDGSGGGVVEQSWDDLVLVAFARYGSHFKLGDQDVLNVIAAQDYSHSMWMPIPAAYNCQPASGRLQPACRRLLLHLRCAPAVSLPLRESRTRQRRPAGLRQRSAGRPHGLGVRLLLLLLECPQSSERCSLLCCPLLQA